MKNYSFSYGFLGTAMLAGVLAFTPARAQKAGDTLNFNNGSGGDGTWENQAGTVWSDGGTQNLLWNNTVNTLANFEGSAGTVDVEGDVEAEDLIFSSGGTETLDGTGDITINTSNELMLIKNNTSVTIDNNIYLPTVAGSDRFDIDDSGTTGTITLNGNISYTGTATAGQGLIFNGGPGINYVLTGAVSGTATNPMRLLMYGTGSITLEGNYTASTLSELMELDSGTLYLASNNLGTAPINALGGDKYVPQVLTTGAYTVANTVNLGNYTYGPPFTSSYVVVGGDSADLSTYDSISSVVTGLTVTAAANGRVDFESISNGANSASIPTGIVKTGAGTVVLENASTYSINNYNTPAGTVAADIQQGTLLINNGTSGSAFGKNSGTVYVESGATLGGNGQSTQAVVANAGAIIAPGDAGQSNLGIKASIGTLNLSSLTANSGLTLAFKLTNGENGTDPDTGNPAPLQGTDNDLITVGGTLSLGGTVNVDLSSFGGSSILTGVDYILMYGSGSTWSLADGTTFDFTAPAGYEVSSYDFDTGLDKFTVELALAPEPSTYALLGLGLLSLVALRRLRSRRA